ncbi:hypothetical protein JXA84_01380 [candidate division WOR-3 bacterium]|nr:hypothetical protein [candidate division WOR-3 bacterium]
MWWLGKVVTWREIVYFMILIAGTVWGFIRWSKLKGERSPDKNKILSGFYIFLGFFSAFAVYIFHVIADVSAQRAAIRQGLESAPPIPLWGSLRVFEWSLLVAGALVSVFYGLRSQNQIQRNKSDENGQNDSILQS